MQLAHYELFGLVNGKPYVIYLHYEDKASGGCHGFLKEWIVQAQFKIQKQLRQGEIAIS